MKVHLFGLPMRIHRRLKEESSNWQQAVPAPHAFRPTPISSNSFDISASELDELVKAVSEGFTHIVIPGNRDWQEIKRRLQFDCRIHLAKLREPIRDLKWPILQKSLHAVAQMDEVWLKRLSPTDLRHPLLLPPPVFATNRQTAEYWRHCDVYTQERFPSAERLLGEVKKHHWRPDKQRDWSWLDSANRRYRIDPSRHGLSQTDRAGAKSYRFCFEIPAGFHYDVTHDSARTLNIPIDGRTQIVDHCNVTPWGNVRRG